ncbi:MAG: hypothetical protein H0U75_10945 [Legionella sp.]|nr:hypothetical protein [Legionella sp.]
MKKIGLIRFLSFIVFILSLTSLQAGIPLWDIIPLTPTNLSIEKSSTATVQYLVTNNSLKSHTLSMQLISGISQSTGAGLCSNSFTLAYKGASCVLSLYIKGSLLTNSISDGPIICNNGSMLQCYRPSIGNILNIQVIDDKPTHTYTLGGTVTGLTGSLVLLNKGTNPLTISINGQFLFSEPLDDGETYSVTLGTQPMNQTCTVSNASGIIHQNVTNISVVCLSNKSTTTTLEVSSTGTIPASSIGTTNIITVKNTGLTNKAYNVHIVLPELWENAVTQDSSNCSIEILETLVTSFLAQHKHLWPKRIYK